MFLATAAALAALAQGVTDAQMSETTTKIVTSCQEAGAAEGVSTATTLPICACSTGVLGGAMTDQEYRVAGVAFEHMNDQQAMMTAMNELVAEGVPMTTLQSFGTTMQSVAARMQRICAPFSEGTAAMASVNGAERGNDLAVNASLTVTGASGFMYEAAAAIDDAIDTMQGR